MSSYRFIMPEKMAIYSILGPNCRWCNVPVLYSHAQIDHIIPESLIENKTKLDELIKVYGLKSDFNLNSFYNWIPIHSGCNQSKNDDVFDGAPFVGQLLQRVADKIPLIEKEFAKWKNAKKSAKILATLEQSIIDKVVTGEEVNEIILNATSSSDSFIGLTASAITHKLFFLPQNDGWSIIRRHDDYNELVKDGRYGIASNSETPDISWLCGNCKHFGPWDGNRCQNCGNMSYPE